MPNSARTRGAVRFVRSRRSKRGTVSVSHDGRSFAGSRSAARSRRAGTERNVIADNDTHVDPWSPIPHHWTALDFVRLSFLLELGYVHDDECKRRGFSAGSSVGLFFLVHGDSVTPCGSAGWIVFAYGSGSSRQSSSEPARGRRVPRSTSPPPCCSISSRTPKTPRSPDGLAPVRHRPVGETLGRGDRFRIADRTDGGSAARRALSGRVTGLRPP